MFKPSPDSINVLPGHAGVPPPNPLPVALHLGCGGHLLPSWVNIDAERRPGVEVHDLTRPLPYGDGRASRVFCEHFIEHITLDQGQRLLREVRRVLCPGGVFRVSTPDLRFLMHCYAQGKVGEWTDMGWHPASPAQMVNEGMRLWGHQFLYDAEELEHQLKQAGFSQLKRCAHRESDVPELAGLECRPWHNELIYEAR